jgi:hypothetical protein
LAAALLADLQITGHQIVRTNTNENTRTLPQQTQLKCEFSIATVITTAATITDDHVT